MAENANSALRDYLRILVFLLSQFLLACVVQRVSTTLILNITTLIDTDTVAIWPKTHLFFFSLSLFVSTILYRWSKFRTQLLAILMSGIVVFIDTDNIVLWPEPHPPYHLLVSVCSSCVLSVRFCSHHLDQCCKQWCLLKLIISHVGGHGLNRKGRNSFISTKKSHLTWFTIFMKSTN